jgi:hypothetical protein
MSYAVRVQGPSAQRADVEAYLGRLPDVQRRGSGFVYTDSEEDVSLDIGVAGSASSVDAIDIVVPVSVSSACADRVVALCAGLAARFHWQVVDAGSLKPLTDAGLRRRVLNKTGGAAASGCLPWALLPGLALLAGHLAALACAGR